MPYHPQKLKEAISRSREIRAMLQSEAFANADSLGHKIDKDFIRDKTKFSLDTFMPKLRQYHLKPTKQGS